MASIHEMREHIQSIRSIGQMTRALQAVSASRVKQAVTLANNSQRYSEISYDVFCELMSCEEASEFEKNYYEPRMEIKNALVVFISADRGLAGSFTMNIFREIVSLEKDLAGCGISYITVGKKGRDMLLRRKKKVIADFSDMDATNIRDQQLHAMRNIILEEYANGRVDSVYLVFTDYESATHYTPTVQLLLPLAPAAELYRINQGRTKNVDKYIFEGSPREMLDKMTRRVIERILYHAILASRASEHSARMIAMSNATSNAESLVSELELEYNKIRQQTITNDILDVIGGAEALQKRSDDLMARNVTL